MNWVTIKSKVIELIDGIFAEKCYLTISIPPTRQAGLITENSKKCKMKSLLH